MLSRVQVEDLFYNIPTRRRAFRSASEEYAKILDLVGRYGVHCSNVAFSCKKHGDPSMGVVVPANASTIDRIRQIHGSAVANELVEFEVESERWGVKVYGNVSNANYSVKRTTTLLFINHRSVESSAIKKAIEQTYSAFLPKGGHPFIYLSLQIEPHRVDVNVHPTKREVNFLHEEEIIELMCNEIQSTLSKVDTSRTFMTQTILQSDGNASASINSPPTPTDLPISQWDAAGIRRPAVKSSSLKPHENNLVRTDDRARKITSMLQTTQKPSSEEIPHDEQHEGTSYELVETEATSVRLTTVKELRSDVRANMHSELTDVFASHTFVGIVDERRRMAAMQSGVKLFLVDYGMVCNEYFYQVGLTDFGNFGSIRFDVPLDLRELLYLAVAHEAKKNSESNGALDWDEVVDAVRTQLVSRRDMLEEYFSLEISEDGKLIALPLLVKGYTPSMTKLPNFLLRIGPHVNWNEEKACFHTFLKELASFYVPEVLPPPPAADADVQEDQETASRRRHVSRALENVLFPAFKARLIATRGLLKRGVLEVANLKGLYRVFERC